MTNDELNYLALSIFTEEHYGTSFTSAEIERRKMLEQKYQDEILLAKMMLQHNPEFIKESFEKKVDIAFNLLLALIQKKEANKENIK